MEKVWEDRGKSRHDQRFSLFRQGVPALTLVMSSIKRSLKAARELHPFSTTPFACVADNSALRHCIKSSTKLSGLTTMLNQDS